MKLSEKLYDYLKDIYSIRLIREFDSDELFLGLTTKDGSITIEIFNFESNDYEVMIFAKECKIYKELKIDEVHDLILKETKEYYRNQLKQYCELRQN